MTSSTHFSTKNTPYLYGAQIFTSSRMRFVRLCALQPHHHTQSGVYYNSIFFTEVYMHETRALASFERCNVKQRIRQHQQHVVIIGRPKYFFFSSSANVAAACFRFFLSQSQQAGSFESKRNRSPHQQQAAAPTCLERESKSRRRSCPCLPRARTLAQPPDPEIPRGRRRDRTPTH